jgi:hypothetical protein
MMMGLCGGAFFGVLGSRMVAINDRTGWKWAFYSIAIVVFASGIVYAIAFRNELNTNSSIGIVLSIVFAALTIFFTKKFLDVKNVYRTVELNPIINQFTEMADKNEIKLFGGDLNFFGNSTNEIDIHPQYTKLRALQFNKVSILCEEPNNPNKMLRYGKLLVEIPNVELRFYHPEEADLRVRGRLIKVNGVDKLLMYNKMGAGRYRTIETDTANSNGALYNNIWDLVWSMAIKPEPEQVQSYIELFKTGRKK